jgi:hypothetical protein
MVFLVIGIIVIAVGLAWIISVGISGPAKETVPQAQVTATVVVEIPETTTAIPQASVPISPPTTAVPVVTTTDVTVTSFLASADDIRNHFLEVAYISTNRLERLNYHEDKSRITLSTDSASDNDIALIEKTARDFNDASPTVKLSENVKESGTGDILIKFLPGDGIADIKISEAPSSTTLWETLTPKELYLGSVLAAKIQRGTIYINANLKDDARRHVLVRSIMYEMGLTGETTKFTDSVFYAGENTNVDLSPLDKKVVAMLYGDNFYNGMTVEELRKIIYIP